MDDKRKTVREHPGFSDEELIFIADRISENFDNESNEKVLQIERDMSLCRKRVGDKAEELTAEVSELRKEIQELLSVWKAANGFIKVMRALGGVAKWMLAIGAFASGVWYLLKTGGKP